MDKQNVLTPLELAEFRLAHTEQYIADLKAERDELLAALKSMVEQEYLSTASQDWTEAKNIIAKVEEQS